jgi:hypothetical protein
VFEHLVQLYLIRRGAEVPVFRPAMRGASLKEGHMHPIPKTPFTVRQPLLVRGALALIVMGLARLGIAIGWIPPQWELNENGVEQLFDALVFAWAWFSGQRKVTPVADPQDDRGRPLVVQGYAER